MLFNVIPKLFNIIPKLFYVIAKLLYVIPAFSGMTVGADFLRLSDSSF